MTNNRSTGIFLHITSLPGNFGAGDLGYEAKKWIDLLSQNSIKIWQICPINPTGYGNSPYNSPCAFAGNPLLISVELLRDWGYLKDNEIAKFPNFSQDFVEFDKVFNEKNKIYLKAFERFTPNQFYRDFCEEENYWLEPYVLFLSLSKKFGTVRWNKWDKSFVKYDKKTLDKWASDNKKELDFYRFVQFVFHSQWFDLKKYAVEKGVRIFGDVPYYVSYESSDVWSNQELFELDKNGAMIRVGGVPPDYFSENGQLWGTPIYRWEKIKNTGYDWWLKRIKRAFFYNDIVRIDHFRAFESFWAIDGKAKTAKVGVWAKGPGDDFFNNIYKNMEKIELIAEDLGVITDEVNKLRDNHNLCGMKVFQFAFDGNRDNYYLPYNCNRQSVMYSGTHDNDTVLGWYKLLDETTKTRVKDYIKAKNDGEVLENVIREILASVPVYAILQLPDLLGLGSEARFNVPGIVSDKNWAWRFKWKDISANNFNNLKNLIRIFGRN
ncbi:MAG: 4-alpha-glucanotransferase [Chitinivibrionia bacterium]|nr:4-alpha-glucanotransferase [Chitinivibrionia bacterium]